MSMSDQNQVHIEVCLKLNSTISFDNNQFKKSIDEVLRHNIDFFRNGLINLDTLVQANTILSEIDCIRIYLTNEQTELAYFQADISIYLYKLSPYTDAEFLEVANDSDSDDDNTSDLNTVPCRIWHLPNLLHETLWETLYYDTAIKEKLVNYASSALMFSDANINYHIINCNRIILLYGPPGTGKTSLCLALAQKVAIRMSNRFNSTQLLSINSHSLFSKWFSESGKLIEQLFTHIIELLEDPTQLTCILIDEVESLTSARQQAISGNEPSDAIRAVNALLTNLDRLKRYPNVLILTTSNLTNAIDNAFLDRADIRQYIGLPNIQARYEIFKSCIDELIKVQMINDNQIDKILNYKQVIKQQKNNIDEIHSLMLLIAKDSDGYSGRSLRKLPFQAHAYYIQKRHTTLIKFLQAMKQMIEYNNNQKKK